MTTAEEDLTQSIPIIYQAMLSLAIAMEIAKMFTDLGHPVRHHWESIHMESGRPYELKEAPKEKDSGLVAIKEGLR